MEGAAVDKELHALRRRLNGMTAQQCVAVGVSGAIVLALLLVVLAVRASATLFAISSWIGAVGIIALTAYLAWRGHRRWLSIADAARLADRRGDLDGRLMTLLADPAPESPLRTLLLAQVRAAAPRWQADALAPRRIARSLLLVPTALMLLGGSAFLLRQPAHPIAGAQAWNDVAAERLGGDTESTAVAALSGALPDGHARTADRNGAGDDATTAAHAGDGGADGLAGIGNAAGGGTTAGGTGVDGLRDAIRQAMGAGRDIDGTDHPAADGRDTTGAGTADRDSPLDGEPDPARRDTAAAPDRSGETDSAPDRDSEGRRDLQAGKPAPHGAQDEPSGTQRGGPGGAAGDLFAKQPADGAVTEGAASPMAIKLGAFAAAAPHQAEPQRRTGPVPSTAMRGDGDAPVPDLALAQAPDAALHKLDVAPEHESIVRRIFTRE